MLTFYEQLVFAVFVLISVVLSYNSFSKMFKIISRGSEKLHFEHVFSRISEAVSVFLFQKTVLKNRPFVSFIHALIAWAFTLYMLVNVGDVIEAYFPIEFLGTGTLSTIYRFMADILSVG